MKNKAQVYILGIAVIIVWGLIIYRIFDAMKGNDDNLPTSTINRSKKEPYNDYVLKKDTAHLNLHYRDPFGLKKVDTVVIPGKDIHKVTISRPLQVAVNWDFIRYSGYLRNPETKKLLAFLTINGKSVTMAEGETTERVKLIRNMGDSIKVSFNEHTRFIKRT